MNRVPELDPCEERARNAVITTINRAKDEIGMRQTLHTLANTAAYAWADTKLSVKDIEPPIGLNAEEWISEAIETHWGLTKVFMYYLKYLGGSRNETSQFYYFEAIFSQPTANYPIPQATASVFFRVEDKHTETSERAPLVCFRVEGGNIDHDVRYVALSADWILAVLQMKIKFFQRIEALRLY